MSSSVTANTVVGSTPSLRCYMLATRPCWHCILTSVYFSILPGETKPKWLSYPRGLITEYCSPSDTMLMVVGHGSWRCSGNLTPFLIACCILRDRTSGLYYGLAGLMKHHLDSWFSIPEPKGSQYEQIRPECPPCAGAGGVVVAG